MWFIIISTALLVFYASLLVYYYIGWDRLEDSNSDEIHPSTSVCIIVPARNEEENIKACIESLLRQSYPKDLLEIIVVDDFSEDNTVSIVKDFISTSVKLISLKEVINDTPLKSYKKAAITEAINQTAAELIITTDADCIAGTDWVATIVNCYKKSGAVCVAGPVFIKEDGNFFHEIQAIDMAAFAGIAAATIAHNHPVLCNGANFAFSSRAFLEVSGYEGVNHITSGDDLLLLHKFKESSPGKISFCKSPDAVVETKGVDDLPAFLNQRLRWASKSVSYNDKKVTLILALVYLFYLSIVAGFLLSLISKKYVYLLIVQLFVKLFADIIFMQRVLNFFNRRPLLSIFLPAQIFHIVYVLVTGVVALFAPLRWKGRKVYR